MLVLPSRYSLSIITREDYEIWPYQEGKHALLLSQVLLASLSLCANKLLSANENVTFAVKALVPVTLNAVVQVHGLVLDDVYALHGDVLLRELDHLVVVDAADHLLLRDHAFLVGAVHVGGTCCMKNRKKGRITHHSRNVSPPSYFLQFCRLLSQITRAKALKTPFSLFRYKRRYCYSVSCSLTTTRFSTWNNNLTY